MTYLCNDQLTRVKAPAYGPGWPVPKTYRVGDRGDKEGWPYTVRAFGMSKTSVWACVKFKGVKGWTPLLMGTPDCFREKLVPGKHRNRLFDS